MRGNLCPDRAEESRIAEQMSKHLEIYTVRVVVDTMKL